MTAISVKITRKGQVTIPKEIRARLNSNAVYFEIKDNDIILKPVRDVAGSLNEYARNAQPGLSLEQMKDRAWEGAVLEKARNKSS